MKPTILIALITALVACIGPSRSCLKKGGHRAPQPSSRVDALEIASPPTPWFTATATVGIAGNISELGINAYAGMILA